MAGQPTTIKIWLYPTAICMGHAYSLLAQRAGHPDFWHIPCGYLQLPAAPPKPTAAGGAALFVHHAQRALAAETALQVSQAQIMLLHYDESPDSDWSPKNTAHLLVDCGRHSLELPIVVPKAVDINGRMAGTVDLQWVCLANLQISPYLRGDGSDATSPYVSYAGLPLRSTVFNTIAEHIVPALIDKYGPLPDLPDFTPFIVRRGPSPAP